MIAPEGPAWRQRQKELGFLIRLSNLSSYFDWEGHFEHETLAGLVTTSKFKASLASSRFSFLNHHEYFLPFLLSAFRCRYRWVLRETNRNTWKYLWPIQLEGRACKSISAGRAQITFHCQITFWSEFIAPAIPVEFAISCCALFSQPISFKKWA